MSFVLTFLTYSPMNKKYVPEVEALPSLALAYNRIKELLDTSDIFVSLCVIPV